MARFYHAVAKNGMPIAAGLSNLCLPRSDQATRHQ
jgi:hypothetical protein